MNGKKVGTELKVLRLKSNKNAGEVCNDIGITKNTLYRYENDASKLNMETLEKLLDYYGSNLFIFFKNVSEYNHKEE